MAITYTEMKDGRYVFNKDGIYFSLNMDQMIEMAVLFDDIIEKNQELTKNSKKQLTAVEHVLNYMSRLR